jgi:hypothetical protein
MGVRKVAKAGKVQGRYRKGKVREKVKKYKKKYNSCCKQQKNNK